MVDPQLHGPFTRGPIAQDRRRHNAELQSLAHQVRSGLPCSETPLREVPEWQLAADRLVDHLESALNFAEEAGVARLGNATDWLELW